MNPVENLPFKTINVYIERGFLEEILKQILRDLKNLPKETQTEFNQVFKKYVTVLGFRNPLHAPRPLQIRAFANAFEEKEEVIPFTLSTWATLNEDLANAVLDWLKSEKWDNLELNRSYQEALGLTNNWPEDQSLDSIFEKFQDAHPDLDYSKDEIVLMLLWVSGRLPIL